jgi:dihydroorotase
VRQAWWLLKLYPAGATTNSDSGVTSIAHTYKALEAMQRVGMPLLVHGEVTDSKIDLFYREAVFIDQHLIPLRHDFPELKIVFEHITTREAAQYVAQAGRYTAATVTAHHFALQPQRFVHGWRAAALLLLASA